MKQYKLYDTVEHPTYGKGKIVGMEDSHNSCGPKYKYLCVLFENANECELHRFVQNAIDNSILKRIDDKDKQIHLSDVQRQKLETILSIGLYDKHISEHIEQTKQLSDIAFAIQMLANGQSISLFETEKQISHKLTLFKMLLGIEKYFRSGCGCRARNFAQLTNVGNSYDYNLILQFAIFNEIIYA